MGATCFSAPGIIWVTPGPQTLSAAPFPGYIFTNWLINGSPVSPQSLSAYPIVLPSSITAVFVKAKRVRIRSNPLGLGLLVDHQVIQPGPVFNSSYSGDPYCPVAYALLPVPFPVGMFRCAWATLTSFRVPHTYLPPRLCKWTQWRKPGSLPDSVMAWDKTQATLPISTPARRTPFSRTSPPPCRAK